MSRRSLLLAGVVLAGLAGDALAVPTSFTFTGRLLDAEAPLDGEITLDLALYETSNGGTPVWAENHSTTADQGMVSVALGGVTPLEPAIFAGGDLWLSITVNGTELLPRHQMRSVPYAMRSEISTDSEAIGGIPADQVQQVLADNCAVGSAIRDITPDGTVTCQSTGGGDSIPSGMIGFFAGDCPPGWPEYTALRGRAIVGVPAGGTAEGVNTVPALIDMGPRNLSQVPNHNHDVDPPNFVNAAASDGLHDHDVDPDAFTTASGGSHSHELNLGTGDNNTTLRAHYAESSSVGTIDTSTVGSSHTHSINVPLTPSTQDGAHTHDVNLGAFDTASTGTNVAAGAVDVAMPYIQLRACQKI